MSGSLLTSGQRRLFLTVLLFSFFLIANSAYLYFAAPKPSQAKPAEKRYEVSHYGALGTETIRGPELPIPEVAIPKWYQGMLLFHIYGGQVLAALALVFVLWHLKNALKVHNSKAVRYGTCVAAATLLLWISGLFILTEANSIQNRWIFYAHRALAVLLPMVYVAHRMAAYARPAWWGFARGFSITVALMFMLGAGHWLTVPHTPLKNPNTERNDVRAEVSAEGLPADPFIPFQPTNVADPVSPFFPSRVTTFAGQLVPTSALTMNDRSTPARIRHNLDKYGFVVDDAMGSNPCVRCHAGIVEQWATSVHRFSSFNNPFYKAAIENMREEKDGGKQASQWCGGCHDPALLFAGKMMNDIDPSWPEAQAGLTCLACHVIDEIHGKEANGNFNISVSLVNSPYLFAEIQSPMARSLHDMLVKSKPTVHKNLMLKPFFRSSEFCMTCHKVSLDTPVNNYRWLRGQNEYDAWHDSGVALNASRTFYLPPNKRVCQDCHMPLEMVKQPDVSAKDGQVRSHRFHAVNTALPYIRGDEASLKNVERFVQDDKLRIDVFAIRRDNVDEPIPLVEPNMPVLIAGEDIQVDVVVRNKNVGHTFPGGTNDSNEGWIALDITDDTGKTYYQAGAVDGEGNIDKNAHFYKALFVNARSKPALRRDVHNFHSLIYVRTIGPGTADLARFRFKVLSESAGKNLKITAWLMWRKFNRAFTEFVFQREKVPDLPSLSGKAVPDLPITVICSDDAVLPVQSRAEIPVWCADAVSKEDWIRFNDYGIANFLQDDLRAAGWAFARVRDIRPELADGPRNMARVAMQEGRLAEAYRELGSSEVLAPGDARTAWLWGEAKLKDGFYGEAVNAYKRVIAYFPEDRSAWRSMGRAYYLDGRYHDALQAFMEVLKIDPEDRVAHYHRMLCYRALGLDDRAAEAEKAYLKYKLDETSAELTQNYRLENPEDNWTSQKIPVYVLAPLITTVQNGT